MWPYRSIDIFLDPNSVILGIAKNSSENSDLINFVILAVKRYIYVQRCKDEKLSITAMVNLLKQYHLTEVESIRYSESNQQKNRIKSKWKPLEKLLTS